jgi:AAA15 family ATPase/GTPase
MEKTEIPDRIIDPLKRNFKGGNERILLRSLDNKRYTIYRDEHGDLIALKLISKHKIKNSNKEVSFEINEESDGTQRIIDLIPVLISSLEEDRVFVIDELDRSLHPLLIQEFISIFVKKSTEQKSQIIVTTHDASLLNQKLLRKDEIWFTEKNEFGNSNLFSLEEFNIRYDKNIRKDYLRGRFGAIPFFKSM